MVDRCVCHDVTFAELRLIALRVTAAREGDAREAGTAEGRPKDLIDVLSDRAGCGTGCGSCLPYIRLMLRTGEVDFPVLTGSDIQRLGVG